MACVFRYDKTFEGLLTCLFHAYNRRQFPERLLDRQEPAGLFDDEVLEVLTDEALAGRVWQGAARLVRGEFLQGITSCWLSELPGVDELLFRYLRKLFDSQGKSVYNLADPDVLACSKIWKQVRNECTRVIQFTRFQKTADGIYFSALAPIYNVYPLTLHYFTDRFADQMWLVYDARRAYGYYYDGKETVEEVRFAETLEPHLPQAKLAEGEERYQQLWQSYFRTIAIKERLNPRLHRQQLPARFWPYLTEKRSKIP